MIPLIEYLLKRIIEACLKDLRQNVKPLHEVFKYLSENDTAKIQQLLNARGIPVIIGFPREPAQMPCYCIILGQESETPAGLGGNIEEGFSDDDIDIYTMECEVSYSLENDKNYITVDHVPVKSIIAITDSNGEPVQYKKDSKSVNRIFITDANVHAEDIVIIEYEYYTEGTQSEGTMFTVTYRIECWSDNGDLTVYMYHILKYIMLTARQFLNDEGLVQHNLSGGDLEPLPEYFPQFAFRRTLMLSVLADSSIETGFEILQNINVNGNITAF